MTLAEKTETLDVPQQPTFHGRKAQVRQTMTEQTTTSTQSESRDTLLEQFQASLDALEALVDTRKAQDEEKLVHARRNVEGETQLANQIKADLEGVLQRFGKVLDRAAAFDVAKLRTFSGYNLAGDIAGDAKKIKFLITQTMGQVEGIKSQIEQISLKDMESGRVQRWSLDLRFHANAKDRVEDQIRELVRRMSSFEASLKR